MIDPLARLLPPSSTWNDPLFRTDARSFKWGASWATLRGRLFRWGVQMLIVLVLGFVLMLGLRLPSIISMSSYYSYYTPLSFFGEFVAFAVVASIGLNIILDFVGISGALGTISSEFNLRRADLLRTTLLRPSQIVESKHAVAQVRVLRMTFRIMWGRAWIVVLIVAGLIWSGLDSLNRGYGIAAPHQIVAFVLLGALTACTYVIEPYWRMKAVTSLGVALSARTMHSASVTLNAGFSLIAFWIGQGVVIFGVAFLVQFFVYVNDEVVVFVILFAYWAIITTVIYAFYAQIVRNSLFQAAYRLAAMEN